MFEFSDFLGPLIVKDSKSFCLQIISTVVLLENWKKIKYQLILKQK